MKKCPNRNILFAILLIATLLIGLVKMDYDKTLEKPLNKESEKVFFEITEGETVSQILSSLVENEILKSRQMYYAKIYLKANKLETNLQAGTYEIPRNLNMTQLFETLQLGINQDVWVTIPEGLRKDEIADIFAENLSGEISVFSETDFISLTTNQEFINSLELSVQTTDLEGFLFPDKYLFPQNIETENVVRELVRNFKEKVGDQYTYQDLILASIVEREGYNSTDRPIIAGIIIKRLEEGWLLQTDATLLYPVKDWKHVITVADKADDNPYNTYKKIGTPPTPICNPGLQSISAVLEPESSPYYYYIHDNDGNVHFATTLDQHNANVNKYLR